MPGSICHLTTAHPPDDVRIYQKEARSLAEAGYAVTLVAPAHKEVGLEVVRWHPLPRPRNRLHRFLRLPFAAYRAAVASGAKVVHLHDPELLFVGLGLKLRGRKVVWDAHEDLPRQIISKHWIPRILRPPISWIADFVERLTTSVFDGIVAATPAIAKRFPKEKTIVVQNFPRLSEFQAVKPAPYHERPPVIAYVGGITAIRGAMEMVKALEHLPEEVGVELVIAGEFSPHTLQDDVSKLEGWRHVRFKGWQPRNEVTKLLSGTRAGLLLFHPEPNHIRAQPNKLFEYMAAGIPVVASDFPLWREIVEGAGAGLLVDPLDPKEIASAIQWLMEHPEEAQKMGNRGSAAVRETYNWESEANKLLALYERLLKES